MKEQGEPPRSGEREEHMGPQKSDRGQVQMMDTQIQEQMQIRKLVAAEAMAMCRSCAHGKL